MSFLCKTMWLITRYSEYHGIYRYMRSTCWYITWYKPIIGVIYLLSTLWNDMIHSLTLTFKNIFWLIYDTEHSMTLTSSWWDTNASGPSRAPVWSHSVMRSFGCSSPPGSVEVNPHPTPLVPPKLHPHSFTLCPVPPLLITPPTKILLTF